MSEKENIDIDQHLQNLTEIRSIMDKNSKFLSLSGLSGVFAGLVALAGAYLAYNKLSIHPWIFKSYLTEDGAGKILLINYDTIFELGFIAILVLVIALLGGAFFTYNNAKKKGEKILNKTSLHMAFSLSIPLIVGGLFCVTLVHHHIFGLIGPGMLIFYGLALLNASKYTVNEIKLLAFSELVLGLLSCLYIGYGLLFWTIGFGFLHIIYGTVMWYRHERKNG